MGSSIQLGNCTAPSGSKRDQYIQELTELNQINVEWLAILHDALLHIEIYGPERNHEFENAKESILADFEYMYKWNLMPQSVVDTIDLLNEVELRNA